MTTRKYYAESIAEIEEGIKNGFWQYPLLLVPWAGDCTQAPNYVVQDQDDLDRFAERAFQHADYCNPPRIHVFNRGKSFSRFFEYHHGQIPPHQRGRGLYGE